MNVYDFDNTILRGDSTARFYAFCLARTPRMWLDVPCQLVNGALFLARIRKKETYKQRLLRFLNWIDVDAAVEAFWARNFCRVKTWYKKQRRPDDVVISASPEFLIRPACERLGIARVIGSPIDKNTGLYKGNNCHGEEKVRAFRARFGSVQPDEFYSDSYSDSPMARISKRAFLVRGETLCPW